MKVNIGWNKLTMAELAQICGGMLCCVGGETDKDILFDSVCTDSRETEAGALFVAIEGERVNGHDFIGAALSSGSGCVLCERIPQAISDRKYIARHEVCGDIGDFCRAAFKLLRHGGKFYCVWRPDRLTDLICAMRDNRLEPKKMTFVYADSKSEPSMVLVSAIKGGASGMRVSAPLLLYKEGTREMSDAAQKIYDTCSFRE